MLNRWIAQSCTERCHVQGGSDTGSPTLYSSFAFPLSRLIGATPTKAISTLSLSREDRLVTYKREYFRRLERIA